MTKKQDSGLSCFMIVMKFLGIPITKEQAES
jgi:subfamily B ATP-binding cassette protein HlyB/CyaB